MPSPTPSLPHRQKQPSRVPLLALLVLAALCALQAPLVSHAQFLSDSTGLVNRFDVHAGGQSFEVVVTSNFDIVGHTFDAAGKKLTLQTGGSVAEGLGEVVMPRALLSGDLRIHVDGVAHEATFRTNDRITFVVVSFAGGANAGHTIEIFGTETSVPAPVAPGSADDVPPASPQHPAPGQDGPGGSEPAEAPPGGGCLVAAAAFGPEMSHHIQHLREVRDGRVVTTESGRYFLGALNAVYYSFSPSVADYERENPLFREALGLYVTPLLLSLSIMDRVEYGSEMQVVGYGALLIGLNLGLYVAAPAASMVYVLRRLRRPAAQWNKNPAPKNPRG